MHGHASRRTHFSGHEGDIQNTDRLSGRLRIKTELQALQNRHWRSIRWIVENVLPRGNRDDRLDGLEEKQERGSLTMADTASTIAWAYWDHAVAAFNRWGVFLQVILVVFCYGRSALPLQLS